MSRPRGRRFALSAKSSETTLAEAGYIANDYGFLAMAFDPAAANNGNTAMTPGGTIHGTRIRIPRAMSITNVIIHIVNAGSALTASQCIAGLYQGTTLIGSTADQSGVWTSSGTKVMALTGGPFLVAAGFVEVCLYYNGTTGPALLRPGFSNLGAGNLNLATANLRFYTADTGRTTTLPGTLGTKAANPPVSHWAAVS